MCDKCPKAYKTMAVLRKHQETVHGDKKYECETCGKMTKTISALQSHKMLKHTDIYKHACHICGATFKRSDYYRRHLQKHAMSGSDVLTPYKRYGLQTRTRGDISSCKYCNSRFKNKVLLRKHLVSTHLSSGTTYKCAYCYMTFANKGNKMRHEKRHADPQLFGLTCEVCHCRFRTKEEVGLHAAKHKGSSRSFCNLCGETFPSKYLMMNHKRYQHFSPEIMAEPKAEKEEPVEEEVNLLKGGSSEYALESDEYFTSDILEWGSSETVITSAYLNC
ncbi:hypothetical protein NQ315_013234 [Exocentrus adspersus]|uniref:C2H2-type domain-containing protein n=1 Tax=Exocentrus adspersus TaxID=1586481 RepID=A0AAV8V7F3_9CUCU|nr:hypothetical protein NQ315_013234 [Exocentrus adspersus]